MSSPPIADGAVAVRGKDIIAVGRRADVRTAFPDAKPWDFEEAAILPGLVNCHTHLEVSRLPASLPQEFVPWIVQLIAHRKSLPLGEQSHAAEAGAQALLQSGTTCVGDVSTTGQSLGAILRSGLRGNVYREVLGLRPDEAEQRAAAAQDDIRVMQDAASGSLVRVGLSPHSPYALTEELFSLCGAVIRQTSVAPAIHAAESADEVAFLAGGDGPIARVLYPAVGCLVPPRRRLATSPITYLAAQGALAWRPLLIHAVHVDDQDCRIMAAYGVRVAHCPRSNARLSCGVAPVARFLAHGIPVGLGTDSLASAPNLDMWEEMRSALSTHIGLRAAAVLEMATLGGAQALGLDDRVGSLDVGKRADIVAVSAKHVAPTDPVGSLLDSVQEDDVLAVLIDGEIRHNRREVVTCA